MTCVQDYVSVAWPVIDATFRYSIETPVEFSLN
jgi:hypothetical protein